MKTLTGLPQSAELRHLGSLDALRGAAALIVAWVHFSPLTNGLPLRMAGISVDLFFILSGFVIAFAYDTRFRNGFGFVNFMLSRYVRLYPMYIIGVLISAAITIVFGLGRSRIDGLFQVAMLPSPRSDSLYPMNGPAWSLMYELLINAVYACTWRLWTTRNLALVLALAASALFAAALYGMNLDAGWNKQDIVIGILRVSFGFPAGVLIYRLYSVGWRLPEFRKWPVLALAILPVAFPPDAFLRFFVITIWLPLAVAAAVCLSSKRPSFLDNLLGRLSYPLYAIHYPLFFAATLFLPSAKQGPNLVLGGILLTAAVIIALSCEALFERPLRALGGRFIKRSFVAKVPH